jgi:hypothetical protein
MIQVILASFALFGGLYFLLSSPIWALGITCLLSVWIFAPLEYARFKHSRGFIYRSGARFAPRATLHLWGWILFQAGLMGGLAFLISCQCQHNKWVFFVFSTTALVMLFVLAGISRSALGESVYLLPFAQAWLAIPLGLLNTLLITYLPMINTEDPAWLYTVSSSFKGLFLFGTNALQGDLCVAYVELEGAAQNLFKSFPTPIDHILILIANLQIAYGFLILLYTWVSYRMIYGFRRERDRELPR